MATRFEIVISGGDAMRARAAADEAFAEIDRCEAQLSIYRENSDISRFNARATQEPVRVEPRLLALLARASTLSEASGGAFDITAGPLIRCWGFMAASGKVPDEAELARARDAVGYQYVQLDPRASTIRFQRPGMMLDLGSIGKGYALERAADLLRESGVENALLHGGTSSSIGIGAGPDGQGWPVAIASQAQGEASPSQQTLCLRDESLSVSAVWGKSFSVGGQEFGHVIDPREGRPVTRARIAAVKLSSATDSDAWSTALLVGGVSMKERLQTSHPAAWSYLE